MIDRKPAQITHAIELTLGEFVARGDVSCANEIGTGLCEDFAVAVLKRLGVNPSAVSETDVPYAWETVDFWADDFYIDLVKLREIGEPVPTDIPDDELADLLGRATHTWIHFDGRHYDAMNPNGVEHFLELSFFTAHIDRLRKAATV